MKTWFTADHHWGHANIVKYCNRPFANVSEMDEALIRNWNERVDHDDMVWHLGDFALCGGPQAQYYFNRLNGQIHILANRWHHDRRWLADYDQGMDLISKSGHIVSVCDPLVVLEGKPVLILCHYPILEWDRKHYGAVHLHGHSHGRHGIVHGGAVDVGVDCWDYAPVDLETILRRLNWSKDG